MDTHSVSKYLEYKLFSSHRKGHGIHSPFIYGLVNDVFRNKIDPGVVLKIEQVRKKMLTDRRVIEVNDLGSGSEKMKEKLRSIGEIAQFSAVPAKYGKLLYSLSGRFGQSSIIELGTSLGLSAAYMANGSPETTVHTIEGCSNTAAIAEEYLASATEGNVKVYRGSFDSTLPAVAAKAGPPGMIFIDGDHRSDRLMSYFTYLSEISCDDTVIVIDDIHLKCEMGMAWEWIKTCNRVTVTVDILRMGLVFFRRGISRTDLIIRY